ncbi:Gfo/Idh/MocA family oxidoreductase [Arsenicitalea aurantiaca]|uniref:Gfo/Idh/MocA family oxidoreductase n=1 Tax=Arsenicitalea aurantiaca TaxID=1783274 RepID=A0A433X840_9HYPH|nr:Gfo/Idh/MocA family oxidoreductase [Arsenicitalea aurantiaca]RUT30229.1 Gfo/Idh/MocA family oxidoreductase [Arsenicitalea aurantiaca]
MKRWRVAGINFDHMHMGDLLREVFAHEDAEIVGLCDADPARMQDAIANFSVPPERVFTDLDRCMKESRPDLVILCPATAEHADHVERVAPYGTAILVEKPFAASLADADRMLKAVATHGNRLVINWPLAWYPPHITTKRLIDEGAIGEVLEIHYYDGNRGPLYHRADKEEVSEDAAIVEKASSWWYREETGGGSLLDYLGYGATLGTWFMDGRAPIAVTSVVDQTPGLEVDEHSITIARYDTGLSKFETRWGTFSDPWLTQPQPKCGFVVVGTEGTIASYDYEETIALQTRARPEIHTLPVDVIAAPNRGPIEHVLACLDTGAPVTGPLDPQLCRIAQRIVDTALLSAREGRTLELIG